MTPQFAKAVDPVFMYVLELLERIGKDENPPPEQERLKIRKKLDDAEAALGHSEEWQLAKYALTCWVDEVLIDAPWEGRDWCVNNSLEFELFRSALANEQFFQKTKDATSLPKRDALEVYYICVVLGFRGLYRNPSGAAMLAESLGLPANLETWAKQTSLAIRTGIGRPPIDASGAMGPGAPPLDSQALLVLSALISAVLGALVVGVFVSSY